MNPKKVYVVWAGKIPGIYTDWNTCDAQVKGFAGARFRSFPNYQIAEEAFAQGYTQFSQQKIYERFPEIEKDSICVDAACSENPGPFEYQGVEMLSNAVVFHKQFPFGTNNIGEFLAIVHALAWLTEQRRSITAIYSDSHTALRWVKDKTVRSRFAQHAEIAQLLARAERWLQTHTIINPIVKWSTEHWGQIPADFGRK